MRDFSDPDYIAQLLKAWPPGWPPARLSLREGSSLSMDPSSGQFDHAPERSRSTGKDPEVESVRKQLRDYMGRVKASDAAIIKELGIHKKTFANFLSGKKVPQRKTTNTIRDFLEGKGKTA